MYRSGPPPARAAGAPTDPLRISRVLRRGYDEPSATASDPRLAGFLTDMLGPYGMQFDPDLLAAGTGHSFGEMGEPLIAELASPDRPIDLLVLAFAMHDLRPGQATSTYLSHLCPGQPMAFSVCDQGVAAGFTALRLIQTYTRTGSFARSLLLVMEQTALYYEPAGPAARPARHAAVAVLLDSSGSTPLRPVRQHPAVAPAAVADQLVADLRELVADPDGVRLIVGAGLAEQLAGRPELGRQLGAVQVASADQPATGVWWELAAALEAGIDQQLLVIADYDPELGYLSLCAAEAGTEPLTGIGAADAVPSSTEPAGVR